MKKVRILLFLILLLTPLYAYGAGTGTFLETCGVDGMELQILCTQPDEADSVADREAFRLTLEGEELPVTSLTSVGAEGLPVTVYCLVDVSGSMREDQMQQAKDVLYAVCESFNEGDNMVIATLGNETQTSGFLTQRSEIEAVIGELAAGNEDTNLYKGIVDSLNILRSDANVNTKRCLLILSDGEDDQKTGITKEEAERNVTDTRIPVYTVATLPQNPSETKINYGKLLGSFARMSVGGVHYAPAVDDISAAEAGENIVNQIRGGLVLTAEVSALPNAKNELQLRVVYTASDNSRYEDGITVYAEDFTQVEEVTAEETTTEETTVQETTVEESTVEESTIDDPDDQSIWDKLVANMKEYMWYWIAGAVAVIVAVIIIIVIVIKRIKRKKQQLSEAKNAAYSTGQGAGTSANANILEPTDTPQLGLPQEKSAQKASQNVTTLVLKAIGYENIERRIELPEGVEITVGRSGKADIILDSNDPKLSGIHCAMKSENGKIYVRDMDSKNGTFVNGIPIKQMGRVAVHKGETIRMGSYEYRIS